MHIEIVLSRNGYKQVLQLISETLKSLSVWKVRFQDGAEAVLFKCGNEWMQRNEDNLEHWLLKAIGEKIDQIDPKLSFR
ncbi:hypothetical protein [Daejeonella sp.]|uniref:hypothetical protein n=1 Tax=Daejeonella sp. TaxID=2805397 RepID=UPI00398392AA